VISPAGFAALTSGMKVQVTEDLTRPGHPPVTLTLRTTPAYAVVAGHPKRMYAWMRGTVDDGEARTVLAHLPTAVLLSAPRAALVRPGCM
jgi:hypothetical protein